MKFSLKSWKWFDNRFEGVAWAIFFLQNEDLQLKVVVKSWEWWLSMPLSIPASIPLPIPASIPLLILASIPTSIPLLIWTELSLEGFLLAGWKLKTGEEKNGSKGATSIDARDAGTLVNTFASLLV